MPALSFGDLKGKVCVITGGSGVIGSALAEAFAAAGVKTAICGRDAKKASARAKAIADRTGTQVLGLSADVLDRPSLLNAKQAITEQLGPVDILINGAGGNDPAATTKKETIGPEDIGDLQSAFFGLDIKAFSRVFDLNLQGTVLPTMVFCQEMATRSRGVVLNISSMNSFRPLTKIPAYSAAKASVNNLTLWLAVHFAKVNIRVNAIAPGFFLSDQNRFLLTDEKTGELTARGKKIINATPLGSFGQPADLQGAALFLCSDMSRFITGTILPVDGGFNAYSGV
jgi:NAD(P)-dependent dehydrogenase (short-subunit alcohol dehydrogenase family)